MVRVKRWAKCPGPTSALKLLKSSCEEACNSFPEPQAVYEVEQRIGLLNRQAAVRVRSWLHHLSLPTENLTWKRNRNQHCHVLLHQLGKGRLTQPFDREPADGPVGNLPSHVLADWKAAVRSRSGRKSSQFLASERCST